MDEMETMFEADGTQFSLLQLAEIDIDQVEETRRVRHPRGLYQFRIAAFGLTVRTNKKTETKAPVCVLDLEIRSPVEIVRDATDNPALLAIYADQSKLIGKHHQETFWIKNPLEDIGRIKAFLVDAGFKGSGKLQEILAAAVGHEFLGKLKYSKNENDPDNPYVNLDLERIAPVQVIAQQAPAAAA
jgi:hypothetical protein